MRELLASQRSVAGGQLAAIKHFDNTIVSPNLCEPIKSQKNQGWHSRGAGAISTHVAFVDAQLSGGFPLRYCSGF